MKREREREKEVMSIGRQIFLFYTVGGTAFIASGIFELFENIFCNIADIIAMLIAVYAIVTVMKAEKEENDEMSLHNIRLAKARTQEIIYMSILIIGIFLSCITMLPLDLDIDWNIWIESIFDIYIGINSLLIGITFKKLEED